MITLCLNSALTLVLPSLPPCLQTARLAIRHAKRTVENAIARAYSHGVPNGRSMELAQAQATLEVYKWRLEKYVSHSCRDMHNPMQCTFSDSP